MNREETLQAMEALGSSPAAAWIGTKLSGDGTKLIQKCTRCGAEQELELPIDAVRAFQAGARGDAITRLVPPFFDEQLFAWKREFQREHRGCGEDKAA